MGARTVSSSSWRVGRWIHHRDAVGWGVIGVLGSIRSLASLRWAKLRVGKVVGRARAHHLRPGDAQAYSGVVEIQSGEIADDIAYYLASSDQIPRRSR